VKTCFLSLLLLGLVAISVASAQTINIDYARGITFTRYHTYAWQNSSHPAKGIWDQAITDAIDSELAARGLQKIVSHGDPDLWVVYSCGIREGNRVAGTGYVFSPRWTWGQSFGGTLRYGYFVMRQDTLVVEIVDADLKQLIWRGSSAFTITDNSEKHIPNAQRAVTKLFKHFPPKDHR
jgi:uncharacterized protein DUF4136